jgi:hypothetical protein
MRPAKPIFSNYIPQNPPCVRDAARLTKNEGDCTLVPEWFNFPGNQLDEKALADLVCLVPSRLGTQLFEVGRNAFRNQLRETRAPEQAAHLKIRPLLDQIRPTCGIIHASKSFS